MLLGRILWFAASASVTAGVWIIGGMGLALITIGSLILADLYIPTGKGS